MQEQINVPAVCLVQFRTKWVNAYEVAAVEPDSLSVGSRVTLRSGVTVVLLDVTPAEVTDVLVGAMRRMAAPEAPPDTSRVQSTRVSRKDV